MLAIGFAHDAGTVDDIDTSSPCDIKHELSAFCIGTTDRVGSVGAVPARSAPALIWGVGLANRAIALHAVMTVECSMSSV